MNDIALKIDGVSKKYHLYDTPLDRLKESLHPFRKQYHKDFYALQDVSFEVKKGETVGIIGKNGSGKSTLLKIITGVLTPTTGSVFTNGRVLALLELGAGFNPELSGIENVYFYGTIMGLPKAEIDEKMDAILAFADIGDFVNQPVKSYSSGMVVRLAFAVVINVDPEILIVDEALAVGDELFQRKCFSRIESIRASGATILFVSHSGGTIVELCDRAVLLDAGEKLAIGLPKQIVGRYQKLLYAPADKHEIIREQIRRADEDFVESAKTVEDTSHKDPGPIEQTQEPQDCFDPNLRPSSTIEYESHGAKIEAPTILALDGRKVNHLTPGESYRFLYTVKFVSPAKNVRFSMLIKSVNGIELSAVGFPTYNEDTLFIDRSCSVSVEFIFTCTLLPGIYYINAGCRGFVQEEEEFLHRIVDAICFRVLIREDLGVRAGYFDFIEPVGYEIFMDNRL